MKTKRLQDRKLCVECRKRRAVFIPPTGRAKTAGDGHDLCRQCYRAMRNRTIAPRYGLL